MNKPEKVTPDFSKSYLLLLEQAQTMLENFIEDQAVFVARYPFMDAAYAAAWQNAITAADNAPDDEQVLGDQKEKTITLESTMQTAANKYNLLITFLKMIYKVNPERVFEHFGIRRTRRSRMRQMRQKELMTVAYERANSATYKADLIAKGFVQADIDELNTLAQQIDTDNTVQEKSKTDRSEMAQSRITLFNLVWGIMTEVNVASTIVFATDYARQQHYLLYPEGSSQHPLLETVENTIAPNTTHSDGAVPAETRRVKVTVIAGGPLEFGPSMDGTTFSGNTFVVAVPGAFTEGINPPDPGTLVLVRNQNAVVQGQYKIEFFG